MTEHAATSPIALRVQASRSAVLSNLMWLVSRPGLAPHSRVITGAIAGFLWLRGYRLEAALQVLAWGTAALAEGIKALTRRPRPLPPDVLVVVARLGGSSFPSGHVLTYVGIYGFALTLHIFLWAWWNDRGKAKPETVPASRYGRPLVRKG